MTGAGERGPRARVVADHVCWVFLPFKTPEGALPDQLGRQLAEIRGAAEAASILPRDVLAGLEDRPVWRPDTLACGADLHPQVRRLLGVDVENPAERGASAFVLTQEARRLLRGLPQAPSGLEPRTLELAFSKVARERLEAGLGRAPPEAIPLVIEGVTLVHFRTGHAIAMAELRFLSETGEEALPAPCLVEAVAALDRSEQLRWRPGEAAPEGGFDLAGFLALLIDGTERVPARRLYCYSFASFAEALEPDERLRLATQLSRRYTDHYALDESALGTHIARPFLNVLHAFGVEGGATLVDDSGRSGFLRQFRSAAVNRIYLPIVLLNYHEFVHLLYLSQESGVWPSLGTLDLRQIDRLESLRHAIMSFRLFYRFSYVSLLGPHNAVHATLRGAFQLDRMMAEISGDVAEINELMGRMEASRHASRFRLAATIGAMAAAFITASTILRDVIGMIAPEPTVTLTFDPAREVAATAAIDTSDLAITFGVSLVLALLAGVVAWRRLRLESGLRDTRGPRASLRAALRRRAQRLRLSRFRRR